MHHMKTPPSPRRSLVEPPRVRVTVPVSAETLEAFQHYAAASGMSVGRAMGDWLGEQVSAVTYAALRFEEVREAPGAIALQLVGGASAGGAARPAAAGGSPPRPVIRGGKSPSGGETRNQRSNPPKAKGGAAWGDLESFGDHGGDE